MAEKRDHSRERNWHNEESDQGALLPGNGMNWGVSTGDLNDVHSFLSGKSAFEDLSKSGDERQKGTVGRVINIIANYTKECLWCMRMPDQVFTYVNPSIESLLGFKPCEWIGSGLKDHVHPDQLISINDKIDELVKEREVDSLHQYNVKVKNRKGDHIDLDINLKVFLDEKGKCIALGGFAHDITEKLWIERIQRSLQRITSGVQRTRNLSEFSRLIQIELGNAMDTRNFFIALYNEDEDSISLSYFEDEMDKIETFPAGKTCTGYVIRTGKPLLADEETIKRLVEEGEIEDHGTPCKIWLGVPLMAEKKVLGALVVQNYNDENAYDQKDLDLLVFVSGQIGLAFEQKASLERLRESEEKYHAIFESAQTMLMMIEKDMRIVASNSSCSGFLGYDTSDLTGRNLEGFIDKEDIPLIRGSIQNHQRSAKKDKMEVRIRDSRGHSKDTIISIGSIPNTSRMVISMMDISEINRVENEVKVQKTFLEKLFDGSPEGITVLDGHDRIKSINPEFERMFGYSRDEAVGKKINDLIVPADLKSEGSKVTNAVARGESINLETVRQRKNGENISVSILGEPIILDGDQLGVYGIYRDITERKEAEKKIIEGKEEVEFYLDLLGHDLGNIYQGMLGSMELLSYSLSKDEAALRRFETVQSSIQRAVDLTNEVTLLSKLRNKEPELRSMGLRTVIDSSLGVVKEMFPDKNIMTEMDIHDVNVDCEVMLNQLFTNIFHNAVRLQDDDPWIGIRSEIKDGRVLVNISDRGPGVSENMKPILFKKFGSKGEKVRRGLGLSICKALARRYGGSIRVEDRVEGDHTQGARFIIELPVWCGDP